MTAQTNLILPDYQKLVRALGKASTSMNSSSLRKLGKKNEIVYSTLPPAYICHYKFNILNKTAKETRNA